MHILIVNDDGPPSNQSSPYVHSLISSLQARGHTVSVCLPHTQRSWIGKAHIIGQTVKPTYYRPAPPSTTDLSYNDLGTTHTRPSSGQEEWVLVDGTPASCVQIGLYHFFKDRGPVDLVVSGPNYGRNTTAVFSLSSGTLGGALEAAVCRRKSIALSYAFFNRNHDPEIIRGASELSVKLIEYLYTNWPQGQEVDAYSVNVPLVEGVEKNKVFWTKVLQNYWGEGSCFQEIDDECVDPKEEEERIREEEESKESKSLDPVDVVDQKIAEVHMGEGERKVLRDEGVIQGTQHTHKHFKWAPRFTDVYKSVEEAGPGNDGWVVKEGFTSVTPLKANFMHAGKIPDGAQELKL